VGIDADLFSVMAMNVRRHGLGGRLATLGVQTFGPTDAQKNAILAAHGFAKDGRDPLQTIGFREVESLDICDFEGCTHHLDLNSASTPDALIGRYDVVFDGGTLEHVFDNRAALKNIYNLLSPGGVVLHASPTNGWIDHGFYQFSPTFFLDYYLSNGFELLELDILNRYSAHSMLESYDAGAPPLAHSGRTLTIALARRVGGSSCSVAPQQSYYARLHDGKVGETFLDKRTYRPPTRLMDGVPIHPAMLEMPLEDIRPMEGYAYAAKLPTLAALSDAEGGCPSPLQLTEDGRQIGPAHAIHDLIRDLGGGRFSHWGEWLMFSTSDNRPPGARRYSVWRPEDIR
jgi:SAM-dependent methyltransferase